MKQANPLMYNEPEGFSFLVKTIPFCTPPQKNYQINAPIFENIMDQFDYLEDCQTTEKTMLFYPRPLLKDKKVKVTGVLFIEVINQ